MSPPLRVLLFSPLEGVDPPSGDTSYTAALLEHPPPGVEYTTAVQAMAEGSVRLRGRKPWHGSLSATDLTLFFGRCLELALRRSGLMFRERIGYISVEPGVFDLIHQHLPALRQIGPRLPVVSGAGYPLPELYRWRERWGDRHLRIALALDARLMAWADAHNPWLRPTNGNLMLVYGERFRRWLIDRGVPPSQVRIASTALPDLGIPPKHSDGWTLGVVARDFYRKGGDVAVEAFRLLHAANPRWRLLVATTSSAAGTAELSGPGIEVVRDADRPTVVHELLPRIDILMAPTRSDCGVPYAILEALQAGTCVVASDTPWLDDRLRPPAVLRPTPNPAEVAAAVRQLRDGNLAKTQAAAKELWRSTFSIEQLHRHLLSAYRDVIGDRSDPLPPTTGSPVRRRVLVVARPYDLSDAPFDGFVDRHRRMVAVLAAAHDVTVLSVRTGRPDDDATLAVPGVAAHSAVAIPRPPTSRQERLATAWRHARGVETPADRRLAAAAAATEPDVVVTVGPWLQHEYRPLWRRFPSIHLFEEDLRRMPELAPQSNRAVLLRRLEQLLQSYAPGQPTTVVSISPIERAASATIWPASAHCYLPFTLDPDAWPVAEEPGSGPWVVAVGNFAEARNADGLAAVLRELDDRYGECSPIELRIISGPGVHPVLEPYLARRWVTHGTASAPADCYDGAWLAIVPATFVTGQKTTILQGWACGVPVVASAAAAATVGAPDAVVSADGPIGIVDAILALHDDPPARDRLVRAGRSALHRRFDPDQQGRTLLRLVDVSARRHTA